jgi:hypothetical protein
MIVFDAPFGMAQLSVPCDRASIDGNISHCMPALSSHAVLRDLHGNTSASVASYIGVVIIAFVRLAARVARRTLADQTAAITFMQSKLLYGSCMLYEQFNWSGRVGGAIVRCIPHICDLDE